MKKQTLHERKKGRSGSDRMILVHSNVRKFFKKQRPDTLYCFASRHSLDENSNSTNEKFFSKGNRS